MKHAPHPTELDTFAPEESGWFDPEEEAFLNDWADFRDAEALGVVAAPDEFTGPDEPDFDGFAADREADRVFG